jgi:cytoskeletal protein CcmA (bactofilin family)
MRRIIGLISGVVLFSCSISFASIFIGAQSRSFLQDTLFDDDLYFAGNNIRFESQVSGDLVGACQEFVYAGHTRGNINWAARKITIAGPVDGSVRVFAQNIDINSPLGRNLIAFAQAINIGPAAEIAKDANLYAAQVIFEGKAAGRLTIDADLVSISGSIGGDLRIRANDLEIKPNTVIEGNLVYKSPIEAKIPAGAVVKGEVKWTQIEKGAQTQKYHAFRPITFMIFSFSILNFLFSLIIFLLALILGNTALIPLMYLALIASGVVILSLTKNKAIKAVAIMRARPWVSLALGLVILLLFPLATGLAILTLVGIPLAVIILFGCAILLLVGAVYVAVYVGSFICRIFNIKKKEPSLVCLVTGMVTLATLCLIPVIGWFVVIAVMMFGLGAVVLSFDLFTPKSLIDTIAPSSQAQ